MLLQVHADGPDWCDQQVAVAFGFRERTVASVRKRCVLVGFKLAFSGQQRNPSTSTPRRLDGRPEAALIALRLGPPSADYGQWSLRRLVREAVEVWICESISH